MTPETIRRLSAPVPRYTSYPTAPNFSSAVGIDDYGRWLGELPEGMPLSLYVHIPFCEHLCWYCGCNTKATRRYEPIEAYLEALSIEIGAIVDRLPKGAHVAHIHWGGGTPNVLRPEDILGLGQTIRELFTVDPDAEFAVEIDPRGLSEAQVDAFAAAGVNRVSCGVQDFDPKVQAAIARIQDFETTKRAFDMFRRHGIPSINVDLIYGLPHETEESAARTIAQVLDLTPDRIAAFGYAHLPDRLRHQRLIDEAALPGVVERFAQSQRIARELLAAGYQRIGLDHFARPDDSLAIKQLSRNFQGYTTDPSEVLIGLGASSIGKLPQGYVQNAVRAPEYRDVVRSNGLATARGIALSDDDKVRASAIERLMCTFDFSANDLTADHGDAARPVIEEARELIARDGDGFIEATADGFRLTAEGQPFVRTICARLDAYFGRSPARHALAV